MILNMGVRTLEPLRVAYRLLRADEDEASALSRLLKDLTRMGAKVSDASLVVYYPGPGEGKRELLIPVAPETRGVETRTLPPMKVAFIVFTGTESEVARHYERLRLFMQQNGMEPAPGILRIEACYAPSDLDEEDWKTEIMIPLSR